MKKLITLIITALSINGICYGGSAKISEKESNKTEIDLTKYKDINAFFFYEVKSLMAYNDDNKRKLNAEILDTENPKVKMFLKNTLSNDGKEPLAVMYFPQFKVDGEETAFCLIYYDSKDNLFKTYEDMKNFTKVEALKYLSHHEMGHCFMRHNNYNFDERKNEEAADEFAIAVALNNRENDFAKKIVKQISLTDKSDIHGNGKEIESFYNELVKRRTFLSKRSIQDIVDIVAYYNQKQTLNGYVFKKPIIIPYDSTNRNAYVQVQRGTVKKVDREYKIKDGIKYVDVLPPAKIKTTKNESKSNKEKLDKIKPSSFIKKEEDYKD